MKITIHPDLMLRLRMVELYLTLIGVTWLVTLGGGDKIDLGYLETSFTKVSS